MGSSDVTILELGSPVGTVASVPVSLSVGVGVNLASIEEAFQVAPEAIREFYFQFQTIVDPTNAAPPSETLGQQ